MSEELLSTSEIETLWRLAGCQPGSTGADQAHAKFEKLRARVNTAMIELVLRQLEREIVAVAPRREDLVVLLTSTNARLRTLGIRMGGLL
jgi:hypothetical protein